MCKADDNGHTPMHISCTHGSLSLCKWLYAHGAAKDVTTMSKGNATPMLSVTSFN